MRINFENLEKKINFKFKNIDLLIQSLTHKSFNSINRNINNNADYLNSETFKMKLGRLKKTLL